MAPNSIVPATTPMATFVDVAIDEVVVVALLYERISTVAYIKRKKIIRSRVNRRYWVHINTNVCLAWCIAGISSNIILCIQCIFSMVYIRIRIRSLVNRT